MSIIYSNQSLTDPLEYFFRTLKHFYVNTQDNKKMFKKDCCLISSRKDLFFWSDVPAKTLGRDVILYAVRKQ